MENQWMAILGIVLGLTGIGLWLRARRRDRHRWHHDGEHRLLAEHQLEYDVTWLNRSRLPRLLPPILLGLAFAATAAECQTPRRYAIYVHGRIVEEGGRRPTHPTFGIYEYDAILDSLRKAGLIVLSDQRPPGVGVDSFATRLIHQVDSLLRLGVPPQAITVIGFSRGGAIAILASSRMQDSTISFVFMGACGPWAFERPDIRVTGRLLSLYETSDSLGVSCAPLFTRRGAGSQVRELPLSLGLGHGTFFQPRSAWLAPAIAWAHGQVSPPATQNPPQFDTQTVAGGLVTPWSLAFAPDGRLFVAERPGRIRVIARDSLVAQPWAVIPVHESAARGLETGLMGLAIDPRFARNHRVYVCYTRAASNGTLSNRIGVLTEEQGKGVRLTVLVDGIPAGSYHNGCRLKFGPDGKLYATTGDAAGNPGEAGAAQSRTSLAGKLLRLNPDGSVPRDNPFPGSYVWSYGHRNSQGLAFQPRSGRLVATEHGTGGDGNNELNLIERGRNYGWPTVIGAAPDPRFATPIFVGEHAPAGATFVTSERYPALRGSLLVATLSAKRLLQFEFSSSAPLTVVRSGVLIENAHGRLRDVIEGPDGFLYLATSNRDGRGEPVPEDDRVIRLVPRR